MEYQYLEITSFETDAEVDVIEDFFMQIKEATIEKRKPKSVTAFIKHDGLDTRVKIKRYYFTEMDKTYMEVNRRTGDSILFSHIYKMFTEYVRTGQFQPLYAGQICPSIKTGPQKDPVILPSDFRLDPNLKRKL